MKQTVCTIAINIGLCLCALFVLAGCTKIISDDDTPNLIRIRRLRRDWRIYPW